MSYEVSKCKLTLQCNSVEQHHTMISDDRCGQGSSSRPSSAVPLPYPRTSTPYTCKPPPSIPVKAPRPAHRAHGSPSLFRHRVRSTHQHAQAATERTRAAMSRLLGATWPAERGSQPSAVTSFWVAATLAAIHAATAHAAALPPREGGRTTTATSARHRARTRVVAAPDRRLAAKPWLFGGYFHHVP
jgi:hypothetical protein